MTREQYIKTLINELQKLNREIDMKILSGEKYSKEAKEHKILLIKIRQHHKKGNIFSKLSSINFPFSFN